MRKDNEWFDNENESYRDYKIKGKDIVFPNYNKNMNGECVTYSISDLEDK